ncbi:hypothetical protein E4T38_03614 [Aureobasidium subglaciale]|nr:hypothetical protein E4T38_03614 [Aureobasidium subglaciale]KAI5225594.1 hypothetical protein E4T40_03389 [Aureobasidium subglaciale]KAI5263860.1 hypothetical protein E4T46_03388 [Aureobasidium subglaciale]
MPFKQSFEKHLNKDLESNRDRDSALYPPPLPPADLEFQAPPPPPPAASQVFTSYPERRGGVYIPTVVFILLILVLLFETNVYYNPLLHSGLNFHSHLYIYTLGVHNNSLGFYICNHHHRDDNFHPTSHGHEARSYNHCAFNYSALDSTEYHHSNYLEYDKCWRSGNDY